MTQLQLVTKVEVLMKIALIQQRTSPDPEFDIVRGLDSTREAAANGAQLIAFAELSFQRFFPQFHAIPELETRPEPIPGPTTDRFCALAQELGVVIIINLFERAGGRTYDSSPMIDADGSLLGVTRMVHIMDGPGFHERDYYSPGDRGAPVYSTAVGKLGIAICYDRHFPEYMRALGTKYCDLVVIPQAGAVGEWPSGMFEAELQVSSMQNGYFCALVNRVGSEEKLTFAGESFVTGPDGRVIARAPAGEDHILYADLDLSLIQESPARKHFLSDRRPELYPL
jgi:N-carbamoylputrescine amidase